MLDNVPETLGRLMPVYHVNADGQIGFLERFPERAQPRDAERGASHDRQVQVGVGTRAAGYAGSEGADFAIGRVLAQDAADGG